MRHKNETPAYSQIHASEKQWLPEPRVFVFLCCELVVLASQVDRSSCIVVHNLSSLVGTSCLWVYVLSIWLHICLTMSAVTIGYTQVLIEVLTSCLHAVYLLIHQKKEIETGSRYAGESDCILI